MTTTSVRVGQWTELSEATGTTHSTALTTEANKSPTTTKPATSNSDGEFVIDLLDKRPVHIAVAFASQDAADELYGAKIWGWRQVGDLWVPQMLGELSIVAGARVGVEGATIDDNWFFADTITIDADNTRGSSIETNGATSGSDGCLYVTFDAMSNQLIEIEASRESTAGTQAAAIRVFWTEI